MKKKIIVICSLAAVLVMIPVILVCFAFLLPTQYDMSFYGGMKIKYDRLKSVNEKKTVVIGGSSVAFGIRSDLMERELGMPVVNFGLYANLGTKYMLDVAEDYISDGDIVIIAPEQNAQALSLYFNGEAVWYSADGCFELLGQVDTDDRGELAKSFLKFTSGKFGCWRAGKKPCPDGVYNVRSFDERGDIIYEREYNIMKNGYDAGTPVSFASDVISDEFIKYLNDYAAAARKKGAKVFYSFCPINAAALQDEGDDTAKEFYDRITTELDMPVIGNPESHVLDSDWFYDSNFHLNSAGAVYYTAQVVQELRAELDDFSPIGIAVPEKPQKPTDEGQEGTVSKDLEEAAKIFDLGGVSIETSGDKVILHGEWTVNGLTEYGKTLTEINIPDTLAGLPVSSIADGCFAGNTTLVKLTFGANTSSVGIGVFTGCTSLREIYITSADPGSYRPASDVLDGTESCAFYVPESAYPDYLTDYFWGFVNALWPLRKY